MIAEQNKIKFEAIGITLVKCNIDPNHCPVRQIRQNPYLTNKYMCVHDEAPKVTEESLKSGGFINRTCVTK